MSVAAQAGDPVREQVLRRLAEAAGPEWVEREISAADLLREDLGLESLDAILLVLELEDELGIDIEDHELASLETVGTLLELIEAKCRAATSGPT